MSRIKLLGLLAALAAIVGVFSYGHSTQATGTGPNIQITGGGIFLAGTTATLHTAATTVAPDPWASAQVGLVYGSSTLPGGSVLFNGGLGVPLAAGNAIDKLSTWGGHATFCPPAAIVNDNLGGLLPPPQLASVFGCALTSGPETQPGPLYDFNFHLVNPGITAVHMIAVAEAGPSAGDVATWTQNAADSTIQTNTLSCGDGPAFPAGFCGPLPIPGSQPWDDVIDIILPPTTLTVAKTAAPALNIAGQPETFTITVTAACASAPCAPAQAIDVEDTLPAQFLGAPTATASATSVGGTAPTCNVVGQQVSCTGGVLAAGQTITVTISTTSDPNAGNATGTNTATAHFTANGIPQQPVSGSAPFTIVPPAVQWTKSPTVANLFLAENAVPPNTGTFTFDEIMWNQGDPNGLGGFEFTLNYDNTIWLQPSIDMSPAVALFAAAGRTLNCTMTQQLETQVHVACASTGPLYTGPVWTGPQVMAHVTMTLRDVVVEAIRPTKENGIVTAEKDTSVEPTNTCGWPLNDGTMQPLPGQTNECQGNPLLGILGGGQVANSDSVVVETIRRLEGDINKDCKVDITDMQLEASKYGYALGSLLYNVWFDLEPNLPHGDGDIDIKDVQFVWGRSGSTCANPIPAQVPQPLP